MKRKIQPFAIKNRALLDVFLTTSNFQGFITLIFLSLIFQSCEEVIDIDLNSSEPKLVVEGQIYKDSVCKIRLTKTSNYFSDEEPQVIENAIIRISDNNSSEELTYRGNGFYFGETIIGTEGETYVLSINQDGTFYEASSTMPEKKEILAAGTYSDTTITFFNPQGKKVVTIGCALIDNPDQDNYYMLRFIKDEKLLDPALYLMSEKTSNVGSFENRNDTLGFAESIFYEGSGEVRVELFAIDEDIFNYFWQWNDILFWKRRFIPPSPYNPKSNIKNGALGYFAAWGYDSNIVTIK